MDHGKSTTRVQCTECPFNKYNNKQSSMQRSEALTTNTSLSTTEKKNERNIPPQSKVCSSRWLENCPSRSDIIDSVKKNIPSIVNVCKTAWACCQHTNTDGLSVHRSTHIRLPVVCPYAKSNVPGSCSFFAHRTYFREFLLHH